MENEFFRIVEINGKQVKIPHYAPEYFEDEFKKLSEVYGREIKFKKDWCRGEQKFFCTFKILGTSYIRQVKFSGINIEEFIFKLIELVPELKRIEFNDYYSIKRGARIYFTCLEAVLTFNFKNQPLNKIQIVTKDFAKRAIEENTIYISCYRFRDWLTRLKEHSRKLKAKIEVPEEVKEEIEKEEVKKIEEEKNKETVDPKYRSLVPQYLLDRVTKFLYYQASENEEDKTLIYIKKDDKVIWKHEALIKKSSLMFVKNTLSKRFPKARVYYNKENDLVTYYVLLR